MYGILYNQTLDIQYRKHSVDCVTLWIPECSTIHWIDCIIVIFMRILPEYTRGREKILQCTIGNRFDIVSYLTTAPKTT